MTARRAAVLGATGAVGIHLTAALRRRGVQVRVVGRNAETLEQLFAGTVERVVGDVLRTADLRHAVEGCDTIYQCVGFPPAQMPLHRVAATELAEALRATGARGVLVSSWWSFMPLVGNPLNEQHPRQSGPAWAQDRRAAEDTLREAGATIVNLPDFYGPHVQASTLQQPLIGAARGRTMLWIGSPETEREYAYVPDAVETIAALAEHDGARGEHFIVPTAGPLNGRRAAEIASDVMAPKVKVRGLSPLMLRMIGRVNAPVRNLLPVLPEYLKSLRLETLKLEGLLGSQPITPYEDGIRQTLDWLRGHATPEP